MHHLWLAILAFYLLPMSALAETAIPVIYLRQHQAAPPVLSNLDPVPENLGTAGATLGLNDNLTTGAFLGHKYALEIVEIPEDGDLLFEAQAALTTTPFLILDAPAEKQTAIADLPEAATAILFNASAPDRSLRDTACRGNLLHTLPSNAMRADALMQFVRSKRWTDLKIISGTHDGDVAWAEALITSAEKFGIEISGEKTWSFDADMRRNAAQEVPLFTQDLGKYDLLLVADELHDFGRYIPFNTWHPRPVAGSEGLVPAAWSHVVEQWGAAQLQSRFNELAGRNMRPRDYAAWAAMRALGEAVTRTNSSDPQVVKGFLLSDAFELAGFKGRPLSFRKWNGQMRQPIPLVTERAVVTQAPLPGYLHQRTELDTLGLDAPESKCTAFTE